MIGHRTPEQQALNAALRALNVARELLLEKVDASSPLLQLVVEEIQSARTRLVQVGAPFEVKQA